jgi:ubiquinone/menaquinone biosynthesis C-methylase UbiE
MVMDFSKKTYGGNAAENYEKFFVPRIPKPFAIELIKIAALSTGERVLDVGCGTGDVYGILRGGDYFSQCSTCELLAVSKLQN